MQVFVGEEHMHQMKTKCKKKKKSGGENGLIMEGCGQKKKEK